jgi:hypothetical protein
MAVKVVLASIDMLTPPCSPNSWRVLASVSTGFLSFGCLTTRRAFMVLLLWPDVGAASAANREALPRLKPVLRAPILFYKSILE